MKAIRDASKRGHGQVVETAMSYLSLYEEGLVITMRNLTPKQLKNLGRNYGFNPNS